MDYSPGKGRGGRGKGQMARYVGHGMTTSEINILSDQQKGFLKSSIKN